MDHIISNLRIGSIFSRSIDLYRRYFFIYWIPYALTGGINAVLSVGFRLFLQEFFFSSEGVFEPFLGNILDLFDVILGMTLAAIPMGYAILFTTNNLSENPQSYERLWKNVWIVMGTLLTVGCVSGILISVGIIFFILPGVYMAVAFALTIPIVIFEGLGAIESLKRSQKYVHGKNILAVFSLTIGFFIIQWVFFAITKFALDLVYQVPETSISNIGELIFYYLILRLLGTFFLPLTAIAMTLFYLSNLTQRKDKKPRGFLGNILTEVLGENFFQQISSAIPIEFFSQERRENSSQRPERIVKRCPICESEVPKDSSFCPECGAKL